MIRGGDYIKKRIVFVITVLLTIISGVLQYGLATAGFLFSAIMLIETHFSLREDVHYFSGQRSYYKSIGRLDKFKKNRTIYFVCFFVLGVLGFVLGLFNII